MDDSSDCFEEKLKVKKPFRSAKTGSRNGPSATNKRKKLSRTKNDNHSNNPLNKIISNTVYDSTKVVSKYFQDSKNCSAVAEENGYFVRQNDEIGDICPVKNFEIILSKSDKENCEPVLREIKCKDNLRLVHDFVKSEENVQLGCPEVNVENNLVQITAVKIEMEDGSWKTEKTEHNSEMRDTECNVVQYLECPVCNKMIEGQLHTQHVRNCFMNKFERNTGWCEVCSKDISHMNQQRQLQHINHCLDQQQQPGPNQFCPICGACFRTDDLRLAHLKRCSRKLGVEPGKLIEASKLLEKQLAERKALGLPALPLKGKTSSKQRRLAATPRSSAEADLQMALALSASMEKQEEWPFLIPPIRANRRKKVNRLPDCLLPLVLQTETDRLKLLEEKVAALIFPQGQEFADPKSELNFDGGLEENCAKLWTETCTLDRENFYLNELQDFISPKISKSFATSCVRSLNESMKLSEEIAVEDGSHYSEEMQGFCTVESEVSEGVGDRPRTVGSDLKRLLGNPHLSDLMIRTLDGSVPAHKLILCARCPKVLEPDSSVQEIQWLDVPSAAVFAFLECIYTGIFFCKNEGDLKHQVLKLAYKYGAQELFEDGVLLEKDEIQDIYPSQRHQPEEKSNITESFSEIGIVDQIIDEDDVEEVYLFMSQQQNPDKLLSRGNQPEAHGSDSIERPSSPDLFDVDDDPVEELLEMSPEPKTEDVFDYSFSEALASSSPIKSSSVTISESRFCGSAKSPFKKMSYSNVMCSQNENAFEGMLNSPEQSSFKSNTLQLSSKVSCSPIRSFSPMKSTGKIPSSNKMLSPLKSNKLGSEEYKGSSISPMKSNDGIFKIPSSGKTLSPLKSNKPGRDEYKRLSISPVKNNVENFKIPSSNEMLSPLKPGPDENKGLNVSPVKKKRSLEDIQWKTPKRRSHETKISPHLQLPSSQKGNDTLRLLDDDPDIWAAFEEECCVEMIETPQTSKTPSPVKVKGDKMLWDQGSRKSEQNLDIRYCTQQPGNSSKTKLSSLTQPDTGLISGSRKLGTPKTKQSLQKKFYDQVTPLPNYRTMITPELKEALKNYGVRKLPRSKAVKLLNHIYELTHPWEEESEKPSTSHSPDISSTRETENTAKIARPKTKKTAVMSMKTTRTRVTKDKTKHQTEIESQDELSSSQNSSDMPEESMSDTIAADSDAKESIKKFIMADSELYEKILMYEPISVNDLHQELKQNKLAIAMPQLMDFLDEECITFSLPRSANYKKKQAARSQRFRKRVLSKLSKDS